MRKIKKVFLMFIMILSVFSILWIVIRSVFKDVEELSFITTITSENESIILGVIFYVIFILALLTLFLKNKKSLTVIKEEVEYSDSDFLEEEEKYPNIKIVEKNIIKKEVIKQEVIPKKETNDDFIIETRQLTKEQIAMQDELDVEINTGLKTIYDYSFKARMHQATRVSQDRFNTIKNYILGYDKVGNIETWKYDKFIFDNKVFLKIWMHGNSIKMYFALNPNIVKMVSYKIEDLSYNKLHEKTPVFISVENDNAVNYAIDLVNQYFSDKMTKRVSRKTVDYRLKEETREELIKQGLIKVSKMG